MRKGRSADVVGSSEKDSYVYAEALRRTREALLYEWTSHVGSLPSYLCISRCLSKVETNRRFHADEIDDFMLTYEGQNSKGVHYYKIKGEKVPETFDKKDMSNYMKASELRHVLLNCCKGENLSEKDVDEYLNIVGVEDSTGTIDYAGALKEHSKFGVFSGWSDE